MPGTERAGCGQFSKLVYGKAQWFKTTLAGTGYEGVKKKPLYSRFSRGWGRGSCSCRYPSAAASLSLPLSHCLCVAASVSLCLCVHVSLCPCASVPLCLCVPVSCRCVAVWMGWIAFGSATCAWDA
eukprot:3091407-Rhodomonas_salina.1